MKVLIMAGGTGGHIFPAMAVAQEFEQCGWQVRWLGSRRGMENTLVPKMGFEFHALPVTAWHGGRLRKLLAPLNLARALWASIWYLRQEKPDAVIGFGGYASAPGGVAALLLKTPLILHEQNGVPGLTNKRLEKRAQRVLQAFPGTFAAAHEVVGNPVRLQLCEIERPGQRSLGQHSALRILVLGGSQGAEAINDLMPQALAEPGMAKRFEIWHQTGRGKSERCTQQYRDKGVEATVVEFIDDMRAAYQWADLVIARSGASTVSEWAAVGLYSLLIPYPWHEDKQQYKNAQWLADAGAAEWFEQSELSAQRFAKRLQELSNQRNDLREKAERAWQLGVRDSAKRIVKVVNELVKSDVA